MKAKTLFASFAIATALGGCSASRPDLSGNLNVVGDHTETVVVDFLPRTGVIDSESLSLLQETTKGSDVQSATVYLPTTSTRLTSERLAVLQKKLVSLGVPRKSISVAQRSYDNDLMDDSIEAKIKSVRFKLADCDAQRDHPFDYYVNYPSRGFGCVNNHNLGAMIVDKNDMIKGAGESGSDGTNAITAITGYRAGFSKSEGSSGSSGGEASSSSGGE